MKLANASAMRSTSDPLSVHRHIRSPDELTLSLRLSQSRMSWGLSDSACDPGVKRSGNGTPGALRVVPHAVAATGSVKFGGNIPVSVTLSNYESGNRLRARAI